LSFKRKFWKIERSNGIENRKHLFGDVGNTKVDAKATIEEA
jgi:hypothetical protein